MKRALVKVLFLSLLVCGLAFVLMQGALAAEPVLVTTATVHLRAEASTGASSLGTLASGTEVAIISHDPSADGWTKVRHDDSEGYIKSDYLTIPAGAGGVTFRTISGVNLRSAPSVNAGRIRTISAGTDVEVLEHEPPPGGWSRIRFNGAEGYVRSDFLALRILPAQDSTAHGPEQETPAAYTGGIGSDETESSDGSDIWEPSEIIDTLLFRTAGNVNLRAGASTSAEIIRKLSPGTAVEMLEHDPDGWSKVSYDGSVGFIRSDLLVEVRRAVSNGNVELLHTSDVRNVVKAGMIIEIIDVRTGITFNIRASSVGSHADSEPLTKADTDAIFEAANGVWSWNARPVWAIIEGRTYAAALPAMPHAGSTIAGNGMNGHICLHFDQTTARNKSYQEDLRKAVIEAWEAS